MKAIDLIDYTYNTNLLVRDIGVIRMVYNKANGDMYELSEMGREVFACLEKEMPISKIIDDFVQTYDADREEIELDVEEFVTRMIELNVILISEEDKKKIFQIKYVDYIDASEYLVLRESVGWEAISIEQAKRSIANSYAVIGCLCNNALIACARVMWDGGYTAFIVDVMVRPEWQKQGIGTYMMKSLENELNLKLKSDEKIMINLYASSGKEAFYEKLGFTKGSGMVKWIRKE